MKIALKKRIPPKQQSLLILFCVGIIILLFAPREQKFMYTFERGEVWHNELLVAPYDITILKPEAQLMAERDSVAEAVLPYYRMELEIGQNKVKAWSQNFQALWTPRVSNSYESIIRHLLESIYEKGIIDDATDELFRNSLYDNSNAIREVNLLIDERNSIKHSTSLFFTVKGAYQYILEEGMAKGLELNQIKALGLENYLATNVFEDIVTRNRVVHDEQRKISNSTGIVVEGRRIIDKGDIIDDATYNILNSYRIAYENRLGADHSFLGRTLGILLLIVALLAGLWAYWYIFRNAFLRQAKNTLFVTAMLLFFVLITELSVSYFSIDVFIIPYLILPLLVRVFFDSRSALFAHTITILLCALFVPETLKFILLQLPAGMVVIFSLKNLSSRSQLIRTTFLAFITYTILSLSLSLMRNGSLETEDALHLLSFGINMIFLMFAYVLVYLVERTFGYVSNISLVELSDMNHPLLRQLSEQAPGTFQHSIQVSILATEAAQRIGADVQLTRTGALYHDIGKMLNAPFFTENNQFGRNPHNDFSYKESAAIIIKHVTEGVALAQKHGLPPKVIDFIKTHHGRGYTKYFYTMYCNEHPGEAVDVEPFTYPGPNPFTKETGILMMADAVEASSRSLKEYTEESISELVERIVESIVRMKLLDKTPLTFKNITEIKEVFVQKLLTMYHSRVAYPKLASEESTTSPTTQT